jgi:hypothetical protein
VHHPSAPECAELIFAAALIPMATFRSPAHLPPHAIVGMEADDSTDRSPFRPGEARPTQCESPASAPNRVICRGQVRAQRRTFMRSKSALGVRGTGAVAIGH